MITGLRLGNFKAFGETQHIPIKPITLIFGANSSGKSSIIHGLLLACHAQQTGANRNKTESCTKQELCGLSTNVALRKGLSDDYRG